VKDKEESQDICVLPQGDYAGFLRERYPACAVPGPIKNRLGQVLGTHEGLVLYTIGQRRGIGIAAPRPYFVIELRPEENTLIVGFEAETYVTEFRVLDLNWHHRPAGNSFETQVKIRYSSRACPAWVFLQDRGEALVRYQEPQRSVTPGQAAVFYRGDAVLGGGWIGARPPASE
jgi:tRNA-specific 2-thiouridylase